MQLFAGSGSVRFTRASKHPTSEKNKRAQTNLRRCGNVAASILATASFYFLSAFFANPSLSAQEDPAAKKDADTLNIKMMFVQQEQDRPYPITLLDIPPKDQGYAGGQLAIDDNNTTGRFLNQHFEIEKLSDSDPKKITSKVVEAADKGIAFFILDAPAATVLEISDALKDRDVQIFNTGAPDQRLRGKDCRANIKHTLPSRFMNTDALAQYLAWKRWRRLMLVSGPQPEDKLYAEALRHSAKRFGLKIVGEETFEYKVGARRTDGGFEQVQKQIPTFTQNMPDYDVLIVADEWGQFGEYFPYRTWIPRPVAGTQGLFTTTWHPGVELWGATQFQNRFRRKTGRRMRPIDYNVWMAVRTLGEAATRTGSADPKVLIEYIASDEFGLAAFKGQKLTYRKWNGQLRQPIFIATAKLHVSVSPQHGFLHQLTMLDTLGIDKPETACKAFSN